MYMCKVCLVEFSTKSNLNRHLKTKHDKNFIGFKCDSCGKNFTRRHHLNLHKQKCSKAINSAVSRPDGASQQFGGAINHKDTNESTQVETFAHAFPLKDILKSNWEAIKTYFRCRKIVDIFNFRLINQTVTINDALCNLWLTKLSKQVKLQCCL